MTLEICCFTINSCLLAAKNGADRIELCANPEEGGTTPSYGTIRTVRKLVDIQVFPIVRSRGGDFLYDPHDLDAMRRDIESIKDTGCEGVVVGMLKKDGSVHSDALRRFVDLAYPLEVTFHRAFDRVADPFAALEAIIEAGCQRILTSGLQPTVPQGLPLIKELVAHSRERIVIMPGSGVRSSNLEELISESGATEFHSSARVLRSTAMSYINADMQEDLSVAECSGEEVARMKAILRK
jgi:copper homeostasis protein